MTDPALQRVLCVDDDQNLLEGLSRTLALRFDVITANGPVAGLDALNAPGEIAVVVSDMRMPGMDGATFLSHVKRLRPNAARILLTGHADVQTAADAVNKGEVFRFLTKPCRPATLIEALEAGVVQYRLITAERVLLEDTLRGSVQTLIDVLALANPLAFGRSTRVKRHVVSMLDRYDVPNRWAVEVAAMLSQVPCVTLPPETAARMFAGSPLSPAEQAMVEKLPALAESLFSNIPRLEPVLEILHHQYGALVGEPKAARTAVEDVPIGARMLRIAQRFETLRTSGLAADVVLGKLRAQPALYDTELLGSFEKSYEDERERAQVRRLPLRDVRSGMTLVEDVQTRAGVLVIPAGNEVTAALLHRLANFASGVGLKEPLAVVDGQRAASVDR